MYKLKKSIKLQILRIYTFADVPECRYNARSPVPAGTQLQPLKVPFPHSSCPRLATSESSRSDDPDADVFLIEF